MVDARKRITIHEAPPILGIQLKRFEFGKFGSKINRQVKYGETLDLSQHMSKKEVFKNS